MAVIQLFSLLFLFILREHSSYGQFYLYQTDTTHDFGDYDCLDYYVLDNIANMNSEEFYRQGHQIIPFCRRDGKNHEDELDNQSIHLASSFTFEQLKERNVSSAQLYAWTAPIDTIEQYEAFLNGTEKESRTISFYNCSSFQQFGRRCEYSFPAPINISYLFTDIVRNARKISYSVTGGTYYSHLNCTRGSYLIWHVDWRDICDGKVDCWNGVDEAECWQLEQNICKPGEYRCFNGQCIPEALFDDNIFNPDCMDGTDEPISLRIGYPKLCYQGDPSIRCEDTTCRHWTQKPCGVESDWLDSGPYRSKEFNAFIHSLLIQEANPHLNDECWTAMYCIICQQIESKICAPICAEPYISLYIPRIEAYCPSVFAFPASPVAFGHILYVHTRNRTIDQLFQFACYSEELCGKSLIPTDWLQPVPYELSMPCRNYSSFPFHSLALTEITGRIETFFNGACSLRSKSDNACPETTHFQCDSKCFSKERRGDFIQDCSDNSDETFFNSCDLKDKFRHNCTHFRDNITRCTPKILSTAIPSDNRNFCLEKEEQEINFATLCDGFVRIEEKSFFRRRIYPNDETDETNCEEWLCDNQYTRCDMTWNCLNGADEADCGFSSCKSGYHPCLVAKNTENNSVGNYICLPLSRAGDGIIDCLGGTDERQFCHDDTDKFHLNKQRYLCHSNQTMLPYSPSTSSMTKIGENNKCIKPVQICDKQVDCEAESDDELAALCKPFRYGPSHCDYYIPLGPPKTNEWNIFCSMIGFRDIISILEISLPHLSLTNRSIIPLLISNLAVQRRKSSYMMDETILEYLRNNTNRNIQLQCYGGIPVMEFNKKKCFCPPSLYGDDCQYQNQRVSLSLKIGASQWRTLFHFVILLFDNNNEQIVQSYHHVSYLSIRDCSSKFHINLLYLSRPKPISSSYSIRIDVFSVDMLEYRASWIYPVLFTFLPVYRLPIQLIVPSQSLMLENRCSLKCGSHGKCAIYVNTGKFFCLCDSGWSGYLCQNHFRCDCSTDSLCVGTWSNRSICVCPINKFGPRCYLTSTACRDLPVTKQCKNGGRCITTDHRIPTSVLPSTICACPEFFQGSQCQISRTRLDIFFSNTVIPPELIYLHFITVKSLPPMNGQRGQWGPHERATTFRKISIDQQMISVYWNNPFHIIFSQIEEKIFVVLVQNIYKQGAHINITIDESQQCSPLRELVNKTILNFEQLRRVKYYHKPCQEKVELRCFHDEQQFICLCTDDRRANCMTFDFNMKYDCGQFSNCENGGQCYQDNETCPTASICACSTCFFGSRCQLSAQGLGLSLDAIIGYRIRPHTPFTAQPYIVRFSFTLTVLIFVIGLLSGILSIITFSAKEPRLVGCGVYLLSASINAVLVVTVFALKFVFLILIQMGLITDRLILSGQCVSVDFLLKVLVQIGDWFYACVAVERAFSVLKGPYFNKNKSEKVARWIIFFVVVCTMSTSIHEALYRTIIDDEEEGRKWCVVQYSIGSSKYLTKYTAIMNIVHFIVPFTVNLFSTFFIIIASARRRSNVQKDIPYRKHLQIQFHQHKYLIISSISLVLLALPRLILAFTLNCMKSARDSVSLFLVGYFISFIPSLLTFIVFVLPSKLYMKEFLTQINQMRKK